MQKKIDCFISYSSKKETQKTVNLLYQSPLINRVYVICPDETIFDQAGIVVIGKPLSTACILAIASKTEADYVMIILQNTSLVPGQFALERMVQLTENCGAKMTFSDYYEIRNGEQFNHPVTDYLQGSLRDDFNFGPVQLYRRDVLKAFSSEIKERWDYAGLYALRLLASRMGEIVHIREFLFTMNEPDIRKSGEKMFDYVSSNSRAKQIEMEEACTVHLKKIGGFITPEFKEADLGGNFPVEATVIIPVRNRYKTIKDAVDSVLNQEADFNFNLIVVDNHSTDGTTSLLQEYTDPRLIHVQPTRTDLGIGGCWNEALFHEKCGRFAIQLDSDDLYASEKTLQKIVDKFYEEKCAMVIGSYQMCNFKLEEIPPGLIDHKEWTSDNGTNNALRINGLGAPRAFFTPVLREIRLPNTSYGEDYAVGLMISRTWKIGRIYEAIYLCRRWEDNSDASLDVARQNAHDAYKDSLRTFELLARIKANKKKVKNKKISS